MSTEAEMVIWSRINHLTSRVNSLEKNVADHEQDIGELKEQLEYERKLASDTHLKTLSKIDELTERVQGIESRLAIRWESNAPAPSAPEIPCKTCGGAMRPLHHDHAPSAPSGEECACSVCGYGESNYRHKATVDHSFVPFTGQPTPPATAREEGSYRLGVIEGLRVAIKTAEEAPAKAESGKDEVEELIAALEAERESCGHWHTSGIDCNTPAKAESATARECNFEYGGQRCIRTDAHDHYAFEGYGDSHGAPEAESGKDERRWTLGPDAKFVSRATALWMIEEYEKVAAALEAERRKSEKYFSLWKDVREQRDEARALIRRMAPYRPHGNCWCPRGDKNTDWFTHSGDCQVIQEGLAALSSGPKGKP